jgi:hypothetical protein
MNSIRFRRLAAAALVLSALAGQAVGTPPATSFTYQGQVKQSGSAMNGAVPMRFSLWDAPSGGNQIGSALVFDGAGGNPAPVAVSNGLFSVSLDFGASAYADGQARWLEITVNGQTLTPRQAMTPAPLALNTRGLTVDGDGNVGVGTFPSNAHLQVVGAGAGFPAFSAGTSDVPWAIYNVTGWAPTPCIEARAAEVDGPPGIIFHHIDHLTMGLVPQDSPRALHVTGPTNEPAVGVVVDGNIGVGTTNASNPVTIQADSPYADPSQLMIRRATNPNQQLMIGMTHNQYGNYASIEAIEQGQDFRAICLNPFYGNVGVGTPQPSATFQVVGHNSSLPNARISAGAEAIYGAFLSLDATAQTGGQDWWLFSTGGSAGEGQGKVVLKNATSGAYGFTVLSNGNVGLGTFNPGTFRLAVNGTAANATGSWSVFSDARLKQNITALTPGSLDRLLQLHGAEFEYTPGAIHDRNLSPGRTVGFIAQDVEKVFPEWVGTDGDGYRYITERGTTALVVEALRELRAEKDEQIAKLDAAHEAEIRELERRLMLRADVVICSSEKLRLDKA